ncbi:MAG TPA: dTMP kinase [Dehalococcoidia bacterium]|nr:dTMP kinase [Dehalococcoidia bacterium]
MSERGRFIVLEGGDGAGKSRLLDALGDSLRARGRDVVLTREPGGTPLGEVVREIILMPQPRDAVAELLLFEAARAQLVAEVVRPALERGAIVLCDRFAASSVAYQGFGRGIPREVVERANDVATGGLAPHLTLLLDIPPEEGLRRRADGGGENHFEREALDFHTRVREGFLTLAAEDTERWRVLDAGQPFDEVHEAALAAIDDVIA